MYNSAEIAERIKKTAKENKITIRELLNKCGLGINAISQLAKGQSISSITLARIADCLDCSVDYLLGRTTDNEKDGNITYYKKGQKISKQLSTEQLEALEKIINIL